MITVMMPCHNNMAYAKKSVESILDQTYSDFELIIVDDGSTEPVFDLLEKYKDKRITLFKNNKQLGVAQTLNRILEMSNGQYFCRQDNDDYCAPDRLERQIEILEQGSDFVTSRCQRIDDNNNLITDEWMQKVNDVDSKYIKEHIAYENLIVGGAAMWSKKVFDQIGYFDPVLKVAQDYNYWIRTLKYFDIKIIEKVLYYHRTHKGSHRGNRYTDFKGELIDFNKLAKERAAKIPIIKNAHFMEYNPPDIQGWMHDCELQFLYNAMAFIPDNALVVEIGCWKGRSSHAIARGIQDNKKSAELICIDTFKGAITNPTQVERAKEDKPLEHFIRNMKEFDFCKHVVMDSVDASKAFKDKSIDFLFLDGNHDYEFVVADLKAWLPKIKQGGVLCGHDYKEGYKGVKRAVDELFPIDKLKLYPDSIFLCKIM